MISGDLPAVVEIQDTFDEWLKVVTGRNRPTSVVRAGVVNACYVAGTGLHFAKLDA
jgi:hypothetical protein